MKKVTCYLMTLLLIASLLSCSAETKENSASLQSAPLTEEAQSTDSNSEEELFDSSPTSIESTIEVDKTVEPESREDADFRNAKWGDSLETVIEYETADFIEAGDPYLVQNTLVYTDKIASFNVEVYFTFDESERLYSGMYNILNDHTTESFYISDYGSLKELLIEKYGEPYEDEIIEVSSLASRADEGQALKLGYTVYRARWGTEETEIMLAMSADNYKIVTLISYDSIHIAPEVNVDGL